MKKLILTIIVLIQIIACGISGCLEEEQIVKKSTQLSDGTKVTGDVDDIEIIDYEIIREKKLDLYLFLRTLKILGNCHLKLKILFRLC